MAKSPGLIAMAKSPGLIAMAKSPGYDGEHEAVMLALDICHEEGPLRAAVQAGEVEVLDKSLHRMTQPFNGRLKDTVLTVQALREYVESIKGFLEVEDAPQAASADDDVEEQAPDAPAGKVEAVRGIGKRKVMAAFQDIKWDYDKWGKNLASPSDKLAACRIAKGNKKASALWNPADIGLYLLDEGVKINTLNAVFVGLKDWADEWREKTALERD